VTKKLVLGSILFIVWSIIARTAQGFAGALVASNFNVADLFLLGWIPYLAVFGIVHGILGLAFCWIFMRLVARTRD
jgi:hypothetical protein